MLTNVIETLTQLQIKDKTGFYLGEKIYENGACQILTQGGKSAEVLINDEKNGDVEVSLKLSETSINYSMNAKAAKGDEYGIAALLQVKEELQKLNGKSKLEGKAYTREGMMKRVLKERKEKADKANYKIKWANNIYGEHILTNEKGAKYKITLRDFENETGYIDNPDARTNKLGTTKHIMYVFEQLKEKPSLQERLGMTYPFIEIYLDTLNDYRITWFYPHGLKEEIKDLLNKYFGNKNYIEEAEVKDFFSFIKEAAAFPEITIRPEVEEKIKKSWENEILISARQNSKLDFSSIKATLFPYQMRGVEFATFKDGAIIADEMGLGKTIQAIAAAIMKKQIFGFTKTLIICPASLKKQWQTEIVKFSDEKSVIAEGFPSERNDIYKNNDAYFVIVNYETVLRDWYEINKMDTDFIILDEAQRIKNLTTVTAQSIKLLKKKHALVITGTPIENKLIDLYSITQFINPSFLAPLWEFSYQHCYFDEEKKDKINGYYNLQHLNERLNEILIRREKRKVLKELPRITEITVPVKLSTEQASYHADFARGVSAILHKKFITPFDQQKLMLLLGSMRMVCDSTYLIDKETNISPKLTELKHILLEKLDIKNKPAKILIFSEWVTMLNIIAKMLHTEGIGYAQLTGKVAVKNRNKLINKFETDENCKIFLSSEAGGTGLNLQVADTVINFELPWNPAKKNQRFGRIDRLGQRSKNLTIINIIAPVSIEGKIAAGLTLKQNLFDSVLNAGNENDIVDFYSSGRSQFLLELEKMLTEFTTMQPEEIEIEDSAIQEENLATVLADEVYEAAELTAQITEDKALGPASAEEQIVLMEKVMNQGLEFLSGLFKMATGNESGLQGNKVEVDKTTGEVVMRFKMPVIQLEKNV